MKLILLIFLFITTVFSQDLQKVTLQLQWKHQFEFAGFYVAKEKGFYRDIGLDVKFTEYDNQKSVVNKVLDGNAMYGVTYASIIAQYLNGKPLVLIANFFKQSPLVLIAQENIHTPANLKDKKVMGVSDSIDNITLTTMLSKFGVSTKDMRNIAPTFNIDDFINKKVDAISVFTTNELFELNAKGIKYNIFDPTAYGTKYYDVNLFTTKKEATNNPKRVQKFKDASIKGWEYALKHKNEIVELILKKYNTQNKTKEALMFEAKQIEQIMLPTIYPIGSIDKFRLKLIADNFVQAGFVKNSKNRNLDSFIFDYNSNKKTTSAVNLTLKEQNFIKNHPIIVLGTGDSWAPYSIKNADGTLSGYDQDVLKIINDATGANFTLKQGNWSKIQKLAKDKEIDGLSTLTVTDDRKKLFNFSNIYISLKKMVMVKQRNPLNIHSIEDLAGKTIVIHKGNRAGEKAAKQFKNSKIIYANTPLDMLQKVIFGKADATFGNGATEYMLSKNGLPYMDNAFALDSSLDLTFAVRKDWAEAISIINKGLSTISEYKKISLLNKWFSMRESSARNFILTLKEFNYLKQKKQITMCVDPNWLPLEKIQEGKYIGLGSDYMQLFSKKLNIPIVLLPTKTWTESLEKIKKRECDILPIAEKTPKREKYLDFTEPYIEMPNVFATKLGVPFFNDVTNILDKKIGIVKGYSTIDILRVKYPNINIVEVNSIDDGLTKVENGSIYTFLDLSIAMNSKIINNYEGVIAISGNMKNKVLLSIATRSDEKILNEIFKKLLHSVNEATKQKIFNTWINVLNKEKIDYSLIFQILAVSLIIFVIFVYSNLRLRKEVRKRKRAEITLKESEDTLKELNLSLKDRIKLEIRKNQKQQALMMQQNKMAQMGEMLENIAHQWRQPLAQINSAVLLVSAILYKNSFKSDTIEEKLLEIESVTKYMSNTIDDFKNFYSKDKKKELFSFSQIVEDSLLIVKDSLQSCYIDVGIDIDENYANIGYPNELQQVIVIILSNAKDVILNRDIFNPKITINVKENSKDFIITICDNAGGIEEKNIDKIFEPYFTTKHKTQGTGLGLYMSKIIIEDALEGTLNVENKGHGACFEIATLKERRINAR